MGSASETTAHRELDHAQALGCGLRVDSISSFSQGTGSQGLPRSSGLRWEAPAGPLQVAHPPTGKHWGFEDIGAAPTSARLAAAGPTQCVHLALWGGTKATALSKARFVPKLVLEKEATADLPALPLLPLQKRLRLPWLWGK